MLSVFSVRPVQLVGCVTAVQQEKHAGCQQVLGCSRQDKQTDKTADSGPVINHPEPLLFGLKMFQLLASYLS